MKADNVEETIKALANELAVLPDFASTREMKIWNAFADEDFADSARRRHLPKPRPPLSVMLRNGSTTSKRETGAKTKRTIFTGC